jgi:RNA-directed DNA polymerase
MSKSQLFYPTSQKSWTAINWQKAERSIAYLQNRITKASQKNNKRQIRNLQRLLIRSLSARLKAIKEITEENSTTLLSENNANLWLKPDYKLNQALTFFQQKDKFFLEPLVYQRKTQKTLLKTSSIKEQIFQTLWYFTLVPFCHNTSDFSTDCLSTNPKTFLREFQKIFSKKVQLNGFINLNVQKFYKKINLEFLIKNIPIEKKIISKFFKHKLYENIDKIFNDQNFFQRNHLLKAIIHLTLKFLAFFLKLSLKSNLEIKENNSFFHFFEFRNNLLITNFKENQLEIIKKVLVQVFKMDEIQISLLRHGFEVDGWKFYKVKNGQFFGKISQKKLKDHKKEIKDFIKLAKNISTHTFISKLSEKIINWKKNYLISNSFEKVSGQVEKYIFRLLWKWARKRHGTKSHNWIFNNYWVRINGRNIFSTRDLKSKRFVQLASYSRVLE